MQCIFCRICLEYTKRPSVIWGHFSSAWLKMVQSTEEGEMQVEFKMFFAAKKHMADGDDVPYFFVN